MPAPVAIAWILTAALALAAGVWWGMRRARPPATPDLPFREAATGLPNRAAALDHLPRALSLAVRRQLPVTVLFITVDGAMPEAPEFAVIERDAARRMAPRLRTHELLAHWGPGEFLVILPDADVPNALVLAEDLRQLAAKASGEPARPPVSISVGVHGRAPRGEQDLRELAAEMVIAAQRALEATGANGPGRIEIEP